LEAALGKAKGTLAQSQLDSVKALLKKVKIAERELDSFKTLKETTKGEPLTYDLVKQWMIEAISGTPMHLHFTFVQFIRIVNGNLNPAEDFYFLPYEIHRWHPNEPLQGIKK